MTVPTTYATLQTSVRTWLKRASSFDGTAADCINFAEGHLNRELGAIETDAALTGTANSRAVSISALSMVEPIALFITYNGDEIEVQQANNSNIAYLGDSGFPSLWSIDGTNIKFDCPLDQAYTIRFRYRQKFALSDSATTNWLLTNYPDVYLMAALVWGGAFLEDYAFMAGWKASLMEGMAGVQKVLRKQRRGTLRVDPMLARRYSYSRDVA